MFVYLISSQPGKGGQVNFLKVGRSSDPLSRITQLQTGHPLKLIFSRVLHCQGEMQAAHLEKSLHDELRRDRTAGGTEWFSGEVYRRILRNRKKYPNAGAHNNEYVRKYPETWKFLERAVAGTHEQIVKHLESQGR